MDIPFFQIYNLLNFLEYLITGTTYWILETFGYSVHLYSHNIVGIKNEFYVRILHGCLGLYVTIAYIALLLGVKGTHKIIWLFSGIIFIQIINIGRITTLLLLHNQIPGLHYKIHDWVNIISYLLIFILFYLWYQRHGIKK
jgi:exosortase/archaeosortase family protein